MTLRLTPTQPDKAKLIALAASGSSGLARKAQADLRALVTDQLRKELTPCP